MHMPRRSSHRGALESNSVLRHGGAEPIEPLLRAHLIRPMGDRVDEAIRKEARIDDNVVRPARSDAGNTRGWLFRFTDHSLLCVETPQRVTRLIVYYFYIMTRRKDRVIHAR